MSPETGIIINSAVSLAASLTGNISAAVIGLAFAIGGYADLRRRGVRP